MAAAPCQRYLSRRVKAPRRPLFDTRVAENTSVNRHLGEQRVAKTSVDQLNERMQRRGDQPAFSLRSRTVARRKSVLLEAVPVLEQKQALIVGIA